jgi:hypothetical protein
MNRLELAGLLGMPPVGAEVDPNLGARRRKGFRRTKAEIASGLTMEQAKLRRAQLQAHAALSKLGRTALANAIRQNPTIGGAALARAAAGDLLSGPGATNGLNFIGAARLGIAGLGALDPVAAGGLGLGDSRGPLTNLRALTKNAAASGGPTNADGGAGAGSSDALAGAPWHRPHYAPNDPTVRLEPTREPCRNLYKNDPGSSSVFGVRVVGDLSPLGGGVQLWASLEVIEGAHVCPVTALNPEYLECQWVCGDGSCAFGRHGARHSAGLGDVVEARRRCASCVPSAPASAASGFRPDAVATAASVPGTDANAQLRCREFHFNLAAVPDHWVGKRMCIKIKCCPLPNAPAAGRSHVASIAPLFSEPILVLGSSAPSETSLQGAEAADGIIIEVHESQPVEGPRREDGRGEGAADPAPGRGRSQTQGASAGGALDPPAPAVKKRLMSLDEYAQYLESGLPELKDTPSTAELHDVSEYYTKTILPALRMLTKMVKSSDARRRELEARIVALEARNAELVRAAKRGESPGQEGTGADSPREDRRGDSPGASSGDPSREGAGAGGGGGRDGGPAEGGGQGKDRDGSKRPRSPGASPKRSKRPRGKAGLGVMEARRGKHVEPS